MKFEKIACSFYYTVDGKLGHFFIAMFFFLLIKMNSFVKKKVLSADFIFKYTCLQ
jgi:hypothetical protein